MKKFVSKSFFFIAPFLCLYLIKILFYSDKKGDLVRLGYIPSMGLPDKLDTKLKLKKYVEYISDTKDSSFKILVIGDSFSEGSESFTNHIAKKYSTLHIHRFANNNQIQTLINLVNGNFFETYKIKYVILENIERHVIDLSKFIDFDTKSMKFEIDSILKNAKTEIAQNNDEFFSRSTLRFPLYDFPRFCFQENYLSNQNVYKARLNSNKFFSNNADHLLFYFQDLKNTNQNNDLVNIHKLDTLLNQIHLKLGRKKIEFIFLPVPDKYDFYYDQITEKSLFVKPFFFTHMKNLNKIYLYIDSKEILSKYSGFYRDIYFYGDTHWTNISSSLVAKSIIQMIDEKEKFAINQN